MAERVLVLIKPDGMRRALCGRIISRFEQAGLKIVAIKMFDKDEARLRKHYHKDDEWLNSKGKGFRTDNLAKGIKFKESDKELGQHIIDRVIEYMMESPLIGMVLEGNAAAEIAQKIAGPTEPKKADASTIRGGMANDSYKIAAEEDRAIYNLVHVSDPKDAEKEIKLWFSASDIHEYKRVDQDVMY